jgi:hypothetical protein
VDEFDQRLEVRFLYLLPEEVTPGLVHRQSSPS